MGAEIVNGMTIVDTDILIDAGREVTEAVDCLGVLERRSSLAVSVITQMELLTGCRNKTEQRKTDHFLKRFQVITLSGEACDLTVGLLRRYRLSHGLLIPDALIAATAITFGLPFISKNQRDYKFIEELDLLPYPGCTGQ
jgi:predicted nucleic acid-binding protein